MTRDRRGLTLLELMVGLLMVFVAGAAMCEVVAASSHYLATERDREVMLRVARMKALELGVAQGYLDYPYNTGYPTGFTVQGEQDLFPQDPGYSDNYSVLWNSITTVKTPNGHQMQFENVSRGFNLLDVASSLDNHYVAFISSGDQKRVNVYDTGTKKLYPWPQMPLFPEPSGELIPETASGLCLDSTGSTMWASDNTVWGIHVQSNPANPTQWPVLQSGISDGGLPSGMAISDDDQSIWMVDTNRRRLRHLDVATSSFDTALAPVSPDLALLVPVHVAWDQVQKRLWVDDQGNLCLRSYDLVGMTWSAPLRKIPDMGCPRGVAVDSHGGVYTADALNFWYYSGGAWSPPIPLPADLQYHVTAININLGTATMWINTCSGLLWSSPVPPTSTSLQKVIQGQYQ